MVPPVEVPKGATTASAPASNGMSSVWDTVYGSGFYVSHIVGSKYYAQALVSGSRGTVFNVEMFGLAPAQNGARGVAKDNKGNVYKLVY